MIRSSTLAISLLFVFAVAPPVARALELPLRESYQLMPEPLTTEKLWSIDPDEPNPHRQRWALNRAVELLDLRGIPHPKGKDHGYSVWASGLSAVTRAYVRDNGPWYRPIESFPCTEQSEGWFGTRRGSEIAVSAAAHEWEEMLKSARMKLSLQLERVSAKTFDLAVEKGRRIFSDWLEDIDQQWRAKAKAKARAAEWSYYRHLAQSEGVCKKASAHPAKAPPSWESMMEPPRGEVPAKPLARAPARRWNGLFSVRLNIIVGTHRLNGQFLIDSTAPVSAISPYFLQMQGIVPAWVEIPDARPQRAYWSGGGGLAVPVQVDRVELSGQALPFKRFLMIETDLFTPPETIASCCDGILGSDFLRMYAVEFAPGAAVEVRLWPRESYRGPDTMTWVEASLGPGGDPISSGCIARSSELVLPGVGWDTGDEGGLEVHKPWQERSMKAARRWDVSCGPQMIAKAIKPEFPRSSGDEDERLFGAKYPATTVGMELLGRGPFVMDLSHGRIWFSKDSLNTWPPENDSGLEVQYELVRGERVLKVAAIHKGSSAQSLAKQGLAQGMHITRVDNKPAEELDAWEVERRLSGVYGNTVTIEWQTRKGDLKVAPLKVK